MIDPAALQRARQITRRHFLVSAVMPYLFILFLGIGLLIVTVLSGVLQFVGTRSITILGQPRSLDQMTRGLNWRWQV